MLSLALLAVPAHAGKFPDPMDYASMAVGDVTALVDKRIDADFMGASPKTRRMGDLFVGDHAVGDVCVLNFSLWIQVEQVYDRYESSSSITYTSSEVQFTPTGMQSLVDGLYDQLQASMASSAVTLRPQTDLESSELYLERGRERDAETGDQAQARKQWKLTAGDARDFSGPFSGPWIATSGQWLDSLREETGCDGFLNGQHSMVIGQGKKDTIDGVSGMWLEVLQSSETRIFFPPSFTRPASEAGGFFSRFPKFFTFALWIRQKAPVAYQVFVPDGKKGGDEAREAVLQAHFVEPLQAATAMMADLTTRALATQYP